MCHPTSDTEPQNDWNSSLEKLSGAPRRRISGLVQTPISPGMIPVADWRLRGH